MILISKFNLAFNLVMVGLEFGIAIWAINNSMHTYRMDMLWCGLVALVVGIYIMAITFNIGRSPMWNGRVFLRRPRMYMARAE